MAYTTNQLIAGAYYAAGVVSREFETVSGRELTDGLQWLNDVISDKDVDQGMVPYEDKLTFNAIMGQEVYFIPNLTEIDTLVFYLDQVRYAMNYTQRNAYFGSSRVENIQTLPYQWYFERLVGGGNLYIYFKPDRNYPIEIHGAFRVSPLVLGQDLTSNQTIGDLGIPIFYSSGYLAPGQLIINNFDMTGSYPNIGAFINYVNSGIIPGVSSSLNVNNLILSSATLPPQNIFIQTSGFQTNGTNFISDVAAATADVLPDCTYNNGASGQGATLTSTTNVTLTIDTTYLTQGGERILVKNQANPIQNGLYIVTNPGSVSQAWVLTRTTNYNQSAQIGVGTLFTALNGFANAGFTFIQTALVNVIGTDSILFSQFNALTFSNFSTQDVVSSQLFSGRGLDEFYRSYLRYALADRICTEYNLETPMNVAKQLAIYEAWIRKKSRVIDLKLQKVSTLQSKGSLNYGFINLGKGWRPS